MRSSVPSQFHRSEIVVKRLTVAAVPLRGSGAISAYVLSLKIRSDGLALDGCAENRWRLAARKLQYCSPMPKFALPALREGGSACGSG